MTGREGDTRRIFAGGEGGSGFIDTYRMADAEHDGVVVRIRYEGRTGEGRVFDKDGLDREFADLVRERTDEERRPPLRRWPTERDVAESRTMIRTKAEDMLEHWVTWVLPGGGFKAQVAAVSRKAAVEYHHALRLARDALLAELADFDPMSVAGTPVEKLPRRLRYLHQAYQYRALLRRIDFVPVISPGSEHKHPPVAGLDRPRPSEGVHRALPPGVPVMRSGSPTHRSPSWDSMTRTPGPRETFPGRNPQSVLRCGKRRPGPTPCPRTARSPSSS